MDGMLLESVEGLESSPFVTNPNEMWELLQAEREAVGRELLAEGCLCETADSSLLESEASEEYTREIRWQHRSQLETRLADISDAQDRLIDGTYGRCLDCAAEVDSKRLMADPAVSRCISCQRMLEDERELRELCGTDLIH